MSSYLYKFHSSLSYSQKKVGSMIKSAPFYWVACDGCGVKSTYGSDYAAWAEQEGAYEDARDGEWLIDREGWDFCSDCISWCPNCEGELVPSGSVSCPECS